jgi:DivIVA domain-containing protein
MSDERMYLSAVEVRRWAFEPAMRGYKKEAVDQFKERVAEELERLARLNQDLEQKARNFHEQLRAFRERDKALSEALISAQQLRAETREAAEREAQLVIREAQAEGERIIGAAQADARRLAGELDALERSKRVYIAQLRQVIERQLVELDAVAGAGAGAAAAAAQMDGRAAVSGNNAAVPAADSGASSANSQNKELPGGGRQHHPTPAWLDTLVKE